MKYRKMIGCMTLKSGRQHLTVHTRWNVDRKPVYTRAVPKL